MRLLFYRNDLRQGGAERALFELVHAIDRTHFEVEVATSADRPPDEYYARELRRRGVTVHRIRLPPAPVPWLAQFPDLGLKLDVRRRLARRRLEKFFAGFDAVLLGILEDYMILHHSLSRSNCVIFVMNHGVQYAVSPYHRELVGNVAVVFSDSAQRSDVVGTPFANCPHTVFPLTLDLRGRDVLFAPPPEGRRKIAVFSRIEAQKPLAFFLFAFQSLCRRLDTSLHLYGRGDPRVYEHLIRQLGVGGRVTFEGHREDLGDTVRRDGLSLVWGHSVGSFLGYSSLELASFGVPLVLWNLGDAPRSEESLPILSTVVDFVGYSERLLREPERLALHGQGLRSWVQERHDIQGRIGELEKFLLDTVPERSTGLRR
jgi:glycosyltransferase involved in cell wall biosynthesis